MAASLGLSALLALLDWLTAAQDANRPRPAFMYTSRAYLGTGVVPNPQSVSYLLSHVAVAREIGLTADQKKRIESAEEEMTRKCERLSRRLEEMRRKQVDAGAGAEELSASTDSIIQEHHRLIADLEAAKVRMLEPAQRRRMEQVRLQVEGPAAFRRPEVQERLNLSPDQVVEIQGIIDSGTRESILRSALPPESMEPWLSPRHGAADDAGPGKSFTSEVGKARDAALKVREATMREIGRVLTRRQRDRFQKMLGKPFALSAVRSRSGPDEREKTTPSLP
jgi:hypothetical protein